MGLKEPGLRGSLRNVSVGIDAIPDSVVSRPDDNDDFSTDDERGLEIETKAEWPSIAARISNNTSGATRAYLRETDETLIQDVDISGKSSGDIVVFEDVNLDETATYWITHDAEGGSYTAGFSDGATDYPYTSDDIDITGRVLIGGDPPVQNNAAAHWNDIGNPEGVL